MLLIIDMNVIKKAFSFHKFNKCLIKIIDNEVSFSRQADNFEKRKFMIFVNSTMWFFALLTIRIPMNQNM